MKGTKERSGGEAGSEKMLDVPSRVDAGARLKAKPQPRVGVGVKRLPDRSRVVVGSVNESGNLASLEAEMPVVVVDPKSPGRAISGGGAAAGYIYNLPGIEESDDAWYARAIMRVLAKAREVGMTPLLGPDATAEVTLRYVNGEPVGAALVAVSVTHSDLIDGDEVREVLRKWVLLVLPDGWMCDEENFLVNHKPMERTPPRVAPPPVELAPRDLMQGWAVGDRVIGPEEMRAVFGFQQGQLPALVGVSQLIGGESIANLYNDRMPIQEKAIDTLAVVLGISDDRRSEFKKLVTEFATAGGITARGQTSAETATPRLKWDRDRLADENPAAFAWRAYAVEAAAGTLHLGVIRQEDEPLAVKLVSWLRSPANRKQVPEGFDIPTLPEWNTRQLAKVEKPVPPARVRTEETRLYEVATKRRARHRAPSPGNA